jgi:D-sedoheptulose 7-phosphate isomerase
MARIMCKSAKEYLDTLSQLCHTIDHQAIDALANRLLQTWRDNRQVFVYGNGGSACTSSHFVIELLLTSGMDRGAKGLRAISLPDNVGVLTALANDTAYDKIFYYPLVSYAQSGDVAIVISGSGNSPNVLVATQWAKDNGLFIVALTGFDGGKLKDLADLHINIPNDNYGILEDLHMSIGHIIGQILHHAIAAETRK